MKACKVIMCGSTLTVKGGMVSVIKNYLDHEEWDEFHIKYVPTHTDKPKAYLILFFLCAYIKLLLLSVIGKYDIVYLHTAERGSFYRKAIIARTMRVFGKKVVMHHHAAQFEEFYNGLSERKKRYVNKCLGEVDLNIVLSNRLISMITSKAPTANVKVLYNAVKTRPTNCYRLNARQVLFLGELGERKGVYDLLKAIKSLDSKLPADITFNLCGNGEVDKVNELILQMGIEERVTHVGWVDKEEKENILCNTMINVLPSYNEGLPMTILETMAFGIPNISTAIASIPEVIDSENGILITPGDIGALADSIYSLCIDATKRKAMSENSWRCIMNHFGLDVHIKKLQDYLREL